MELEKFDRQLRLMVLLTQNRLLTIEDISRDLHMSKRSIYRYIEAFRQMGFIVIKEGTRYRIDHSSPFFHTITERIHFTTDEALVINQVLHSVIDHSPQMRHLREKLGMIYAQGLLIAQQRPNRQPPGGTLPLSGRKQRGALLRNQFGHEQDFQGGPCRKCGGARPPVGAQGQTRAFFHRPVPL